MASIYLAMLHAENTNVCSNEDLSPALKKMVAKIISAYTLNQDLDFQRDPIKNLYSKKFAEKFGEEENLLYRSKLAYKMLPQFKPDFIFTAGGINSLVGVFVKGPLEFNFTDNSCKVLNVKTLAEGNTIQGFYKRNVDKDTKLLYVGYHSCMDRFPEFYKGAKALDSSKSSINNLAEAFIKIKSSAKIPDNEFSLVKAADYAQLPADALRIEINSIQEILLGLAEGLKSYIADENIFSLRRNITAFVNLKSKIEVSNRALGASELNYRLELLKLNLFN